MCVLFYTFIISDAFYNSNVIMKGKQHSKYRSFITFEDKTMNNSDYVILSSNSNFFFLYSSKSKEVIIVPVKQIKSITLKASN